MRDKPNENGPLGRHKLRWKDNIETDLKQIGWDGVKEIYMN
jgi:hypothetical protein